MVLGPVREVPQLIARGSERFTDRDFESRSWWLLVRELVGAPRLLSGAVRAEHQFQQFRTPLYLGPLVIKVPQSFGRADEYKQLKPEEVREGTFSISNYGSYGSLLATPAINQPQSAILGLGAVHKAAVVINDAIAIRSISYVTLTFDHRLLDGAVADSFLNHMKGVIEGWDEPVL